MIVEPSWPATSATADVVVDAVGGAASPRTSSGALREYRRLGYRIALTDSVAVMAAFVGAYLIRFGLGRPPLEFVLVMAVAPPLFLAVFAGWRLYAIHRLAPAEEFRRVVAAVSIGITLVVTVSFWSKASFSRLWIAGAWVLSLVLVLATRQAWHWWIGRRRIEGGLTFRTLIAGANGEAAHLARVLASRPMGFAPVGFVLNGNGQSRLEGLPVLGDLTQIRDTIRMTGADCIIVASSALSPEQVRAVAKAARLEGIELRVSANLPETQSTRVTAQPLGGVMILSVQPVRLTGTQAALKRTFDVVASLLALIALAPVFAVIMLAVRLDSRGQMFFQQERIGRRGRPFTLLKFRTMVVGADAALEDLLDLNEYSGPVFKIRGDPRVTSVGQFLRRWSLDELPQLINVLRGDMSLVGPRPLQAVEAEAYPEWHDGRMYVQPGITGLWQVSGRSDLSLEERMRLDFFYIENWSLAYDLFILMKTVPAVLARRGSY